MLSYRNSCLFPLEGDCFLVQVPLIHFSLILYSPITFLSRYQSRTLTNPPVEQVELLRNSQVPLDRAHWRGTPTAHLTIHSAQRNQIDSYPNSLKAVRVPPWGGGMRIGGRNRPSRAGTPKPQLRECPGWRRDPRSVLCSQLPGFQSLLLPGRPWLQK